MGISSFTEELEKEGKMTEDTKILMKEITEKKPAEKSAESSNIRRRHSYDWWNEEENSGKHPSYVYDAEKDKWTESVHASPVPAKFISSTPTDKKVKKKQKCVIM